MKSKVTSPLYVLVFLSWLMYLPFFLNRKWLNWEIPEMLNNYFTDLLCIPFVLGSTLILLQWIKNDKFLRLSNLQILATVVYFSLIFEWILPFYNIIYTRDLADVFCYAIGGVLFYYIQKLHFSKSNTM